MSLIPGNSAPETGLSDKWEHGICYMVLAFLFCLGWRKPFIGGLAAIMMGIIIELIQGGMGHRTLDWLDAMANGAGAVMGIAIYLALGRLPLLSRNRI
ncbi:VanZ family protein [Aestuariispira insulae]|nr:VanZ family protein [Aestuariispira insulae]